MICRYLVSSPRWTVFLILLIFKLSQYDMNIFLHLCLLAISAKTCASLQKNPSDSSRALPKPAPSFGLEARSYTLAESLQLPESSSEPAAKVPSLQMATSALKAAPGIAPLNPVKESLSNLNKTRSISIPVSLIFRRGTKDAAGKDRRTKSVRSSKISGSEKSNPKPYKVPDVTLARKTQWPPGFQELSDDAKSYQPNEGSSGTLKHLREDNPRRQGTGRSRSPSKSPGFLTYVNDANRYDRSYLTSRKVKDSRGISYKAPIAVVDSMALPKVSAKVMRYLKENPQHYFFKLSPANNHKTQKSAKSIQRPPSPQSKVGEREKQPTSKAHRVRLQKKTVAPTLSGEVKLAENLMKAGVSHARAMANTYKQNTAYMGISVLHPEELKFDYGNNNWGSYNMPNDAE